MGLISYLRSVRQAVSAVAILNRNVHVVIGNEACDLDSAVSAVVAAYLLSSKGDELVVPMLHIPRADYPLKTEVQFVFNKHQITESLLTFLDDLPLNDLHNAKQLEMTLVDHNVVAGCLEPVNDAVVRVIDHHKWEATFSSPVDKTIEMVGSCATLVAERVLEANREIVDHTVAKLLISAIITDTVNFSESAKKATPKDVKVFRELSTLTPDMDWHKEFVDIKEAKASVDWMTVRDLLRKDQKVLTANGLTISMSTVPLSLKKLVTKSNFQTDLESFRQQQKVDVVIVMTARTKAKADASVDVRRGMVIHAEVDRLREALIDYLKSFADPSLDLKDTDSWPEGYSGHSTTKLLFQNNAAASRKVVLPAVRTFAESYKAAD